MTHKLFFGALMSIALIALSSLFVLSLPPSSWQYNWALRTDRYGKPAGVFQQTPFPIYENTTSYTIETDEQAKTYYLGIKYYVDGYAGNDSNNGLSLQAPKKTISAAITSAGHGNKTIVVRGAHDSFNGVYNVSSTLHLGYGIDDTHRWILVGYGQERPILDAGNNAVQIIHGTGQPVSFTTVQRLKIQNSASTGLHPGNSAGLPKQDAYWNTIDTWLYNCTSVPTTPASGDGNLYYYNIDNGWIFHITSEHTTGHGIKSGDTIGGRNTIIEWCYVADCGWWKGWTGPTAFWGSHPAGIDIPTDAPNQSDNIIIRYNIVRTTLYYGIMVRRTSNFSIHHNEVFDTIHFEQIPQPGEGGYTCEESSNGRYQVLFTGIGGIESGSFYGNIVHDQGNSSTGAISIDSTAPGSYIRIYNNQIYGNDSAIDMADSLSGQFSIVNNSILASTSEPDPAIHARNIGSNVSILNNIIYQAGSGRCIRWYTSEPTHDSNLFYAPNGSIGLPLHTGDRTGDPHWEKHPAGAYDASNFRLTQPLPGIAQTAFYDDFLGILRQTWDKGCLDSAARQLPPPENLRIK